MTIKEAMAEIERLRGQIEDLRDLAYNRAPKLAAEECDQKTAELRARLEAAETNADLQKGMAEDATIRQFAAERLLRDANAWLEAETARADEARAERYRKALKRFAYETNWESRTTGAWIWDVDGVPWELAQEALRDAAPDAGKEEAE